MEETALGQRIKCASSPDISSGELAREVWSPKIGHLRLLSWSPDNLRLLAQAYVEWPSQKTKPEPPISSPILFVTSWSSVRQGKILWQNTKLKNSLPDARWAFGGRFVTFAVTSNGGAYAIPKSLHVVRPDGNGLRTLWRGEFTDYVLSPDGKRALLWVLDSPWYDCPEPTQMGAVNIESGKKKLYPRGVVAVGMNCEDGLPGQKPDWSRREVSSSDCARAVES